jgi:hypothetical protein
MSNLKFTPLFRALSVRVIFVLLTSISLLSGCSRTYDWRTVQSEEGAYEAMFPSKPSSAEKTILALGDKYLISMQAAKAGNALFAVSTIKVANDAVKADELIDWLKSQTRKTLKVDGDIIEQSDVAFTVASNHKERLTATGMKISGKGPDDLPRFFWVRWVKRVDSLGQLRIYQLSVIQSLDNKMDDQAVKQLQEEYETFYAGFHPY